jgi:hypothetical protein
MASHFARVVSHASTESERRRSQRKPHVVEAYLASPTGGKKLGVSCVDVSKHGVRLKVAQPIATGTYHVLELGFDAQKRGGEVRILSCRREADGAYHVHAEFC